MLNVSLVAARIVEVCVVHAQAVDANDHANEEQKHEVRKPNNEFCTQSVEQVGVADAALIDGIFDAEVRADHVRCQHENRSIPRLRFRP